MKKTLAALMALIVFCVCASAETMIGAQINVRASRDVRDSVIRAGEDVELIVTLTGFVPEGCLWYKDGALVDGETEPTLRVIGAQVEDTGLYRMDALDGEGRVRISVEAALRVVDDAVPQTGDYLPIDKETVWVLLAAAVVLTAFAIGSARRAKI